jgi:hypothetical protein
MNSVVIAAILVIVAVGVFVLFRWTDRMEDERAKQQSEEWERRRLSEENVLKAKANFEHRLNENADLPDAIVWRKAYIYRHLMSKWFDILIAKYRYDEPMSTKLRSDWLTYMGLLESESTSSFLGREARDETKRDTYGEEAHLEHKQYVAIENAFAAAIGNEAVEELQRTREAPHDAFDRSGKKPIAPAGCSYVPVSLRPYDEKLKPQK